MKRVLILNVDSFVGKHVCRRFYDAKEYIVDGTFYHHFPNMEEINCGWPRADVVKEETPGPDTSVGGFDENVTYDLSSGAFCGEMRADHRVNIPTAITAFQEERVDVETQEAVNDMKPYLNAVVSRHFEVSDEEFRLRLLSYDIIIAILEENAFEAECAIKILRGTHYEVEKTFVLVSNVFTWAQTDRHEHEKKMAKRREEREAERALRKEELANRRLSGHEDLTEDEEESGEDAEESEEEMVAKVWSEDEYRLRYPDIRYHAWRELEHMVKAANSETLHTYVIWAGLPYGCGEDLLSAHFLAAWSHQQLLQYGDGLNYIPTIHVQDLSRIIYLVGSSYDTLEDRYMFAVDQGNNTQREILRSILDFIGGKIEITSPVVDRSKQVVKEMEHRKEVERLRKSAEELDDVISSYIKELKTLERSNASFEKRIRELEEDTKKQMMYKTIVAQKGQKSVDDNIRRNEEDKNRCEQLLQEVVAKENQLRELLKEKEQERGVVMERLGLFFLTNASEEVEKVGLLLGSFDSYDNRATSPETAAVDVGLYIDQPHGVANWLSAVDIRCEPGAVLSLLGDTDWVSINGFVANMNKIVEEFRLERLLCPMRLAVVGPPMSKVGEVSGALASLFNVVHLTIDKVTAAYEAHVARIREKMVEILLRRRARRQEAVEQRALRERLRRRMRRKELLRLKREAQGHINAGDNAEGSGSEEEEEEEEEEGVEGEEGGGDNEEEEEEDDDDNNDNQRSLDSPMLAAEALGQYVISEDALLNEQDEEEEEEMEESGEESIVDEKAQQLAQKVDEEERFEIATLREEYRFGTKVLKLQLVNGRFPQPTKPEYDAGDEEEDEEGRNFDDRATTLSYSENKTISELPTVTRYIDEALAVMVRWRLRQPDCRNQGYVLQNFPETVRQARLVFLAVPQEGEQQAHKAQRGQGDREVPKPCDVNFPIPPVEELEAEKQQELLDAMDGKTFLPHEEALAPTNDAFFPDCLIFIQTDAVFLQRELSKAMCDDPEDTDGRSFHEDLTRFQKHNGLNGPPTESLISWYQTVVTERADDGDEGMNGTSWSNEGTGGKEKLRRSISVVITPPFSMIPSGGKKLSRNGSMSEKDEFDAYCSTLRERVLNNVGLLACGEVIDEMKAEGREKSHLIRRLEQESDALSHLRRGFKVFLRKDEAKEGVRLEQERCVLCYFEAKEACTEVAGLENLPSDIYLMRYVLPSLVPLMAEVVRMRPDDPVTALADRLFYYKRQKTL